MLLYNMKIIRYKILKGAIMNIAFFIHTMGRGGAEMALVNLANALTEQGENVTLYSILNTGNLSTKISGDVIYKPIFDLPSIVEKRNVNNTGTLIKGSNGLSNVAKFYAMMWRIFHKQISKIGSKKVGEHDVYISYLEGPTSKFVANLETNKRKIAWVHVDLNRERKSELFFRNQKENREHYNNFDEIVAVSDDVKKSLCNYLQIDKDVHVIYNIYNVEEIITKSTMPLSEKKKNSLDPTKINIVSVGRLSSQKGYDRLINAIRSLKDSNYDLYEHLNVVIIGDGELEIPLNNLIHELEVEDAISLFGFTDNPYNLISNSDLFISSSRTEGFSTVAVEATILGKYIVTTDCSGMREIISNDSQGKIFKNSTEGIEESLRFVISNIDMIRNGAVDNNIEDYINSLRDHEDLLSNIF